MTIVLTYPQIFICTQCQWVTTEGKDGEPDPCPFCPESTYEPVIMEGDDGLA